MHWQPRTPICDAFFDIVDMATCAESLSVLKSLRGLYFTALLQESIAICDEVLSDSPEVVDRVPGATQLVDKLRTYVGDIDLTCLRVLAITTVDKACVSHFGGLAATRNM